MYLTISSFTICLKFTLFSKRTLFLLNRYTTDLANESIGTYRICTIEQHVLRPRLSSGIYVIPRCHRNTGRSSKIQKQVQPPKNITKRIFSSPDLWAKNSVWPSLLHHTSCPCEGQISIFGTRSVCSLIHSFIHSFIRFHF